jgi:hypothetical protein
MNDSLTYVISVIFFVFIYLAIYCGMNKYNCLKRGGIYLPIGKELISPFEELWQGRIKLFFQMIFSINTPWLFILIGVIVAAIYIHFIKEKEDDVDEEDDN